MPGALAGAGRFSFVVSVAARIGCVADTRYLNFMDNDSTFMRGFEHHFPRAMLLLAGLSGFGLILWIAQLITHLGRA